MFENIFRRLRRDRKAFMLYAHMSGTLIPLSEVKDEVFSSGMLGVGIAIEPDGNKLFSPCSGTVGHIFDTHHAINIVSDFGSEILLHIGLDTVKLKGKGFDIKVKEGDRINKGDLLCVFDPDIIKGAGLMTTTPMVITNSMEYSKIDTRPACTINAGDSVMKIEK